MQTPNTLRSGINAEDVLIKLQNIQQKFVFLKKLFLAVRIVIDADTEKAPVIQNRQQTKTEKPHLFPDGQQELSFPIRRDGITGSLSESAFQIRPLTVKSALYLFFLFKAIFMQHVPGSFIGGEQPDTSLLFLCNDYRFVRKKIHLAYSLVVSALSGVLNGYSPLPAMGKQFIKWKRLTVIVALKLLTAALFQKVSLLSGFHALRQSPASDLFVHGNHGSDDAARTRRILPQKSHIHLEHIKRIILQQIQRGIAAPEIIDPDLIPRTAEPIQTVGNFILARGQGALRHLDVKHTTGNVILFDQRLDLIKNVTAQKIHSGQIQGNRNLGTVSGISLRDLLHHLADHAKVQLPDQLCLFQRLDKRGRKKKSSPGILPPRQSLHSAELAGNRTDDGLIIDLNPVPPDCLIEERRHIFRHLQIFSHRLGVEGKEGVHMLSVVITGDLRTAADCFRRKIRILPDTGSDAAVDGVGSRLFDHLPKVHSLFLYLTGGSENRKVIPAEVGGHAFRKTLSDAPACGLQKTVSVGNPVADVHAPEVDQVHK